ncbi:hypothetical protein M440DRAFT_1442275 [Trichoderma longibrachiatum ATCC 18648]|uniref:DUF8032 domain-containing protein n=1 Tax=Trichoderma longibrachiatum ATCC 18648 TaxID=983965 RepID=A0A2T4BRP7_TRILO|nr:hypothetical protein M440DRAFT_1442275 [Trichoderma longibrachiatum ATCC 18648]
MPPSGGDDVRQAHVFAGYAGPSSYPVGGGQGGSMSHMAPRANGAIPARSHSRAAADDDDDGNGSGGGGGGSDGLFPDIPEAKRRKFILVEDNVRGNRLRVRVTLDGVDTNEIPDSFRKGASVFPRSYFPREMQSPPPSATGSRFFADDVSDDGDDGTQETEGREASRRGGGAGSEKLRGEVVKVVVAEGQEVEATIPRMKKSARTREVRLNDLGYRMAWLQSRVFSGRTVFLQRALDCYRNKTRAAIESTMADVHTVAPHFETRPGKRRWAGRMKRGAKNADD